MTIMMVETDIITSIAASLIGWTLILVIMYVKTHIIVFIGKNILKFFFSETNLKT